MHTPYTDPASGVQNAAIYRKWCVIVLGLFFIMGWGRLHPKNYKRWGLNKSYYITLEFATAASENFFLHNSTNVSYTDLVWRLLYDKWCIEKIIFCHFLKKLVFLWKQSLKVAKSVLWCSRCKIHRYVAAPLKCDAFKFLLFCVVTEHHFAYVTCSGLTPSNCFRRIDFYVCVRCKYCES